MTIPKDGNVVDLGIIEPKSKQGWGETDAIVINGDDVSLVNYVQCAVASGLMYGMSEDITDCTINSENGTIKYQMNTVDFAPKNTATRAEASAVMNRMINML